MARLPTPGGDNGDWGTILNDFLSRIHSNDGTLKPNSVGSTQIQEDAVTSSSIAPGAVTASSLAPAAVTSDAIAPAAITTDAIAPNAVTVEALAPNTIDDTVIADGSITNQLIADATIEETKLASAVQAKLNTTAPVTSVATRTGDVTLDKADVGLGNVDNTSDASKPISTATQTALDGKQGLSATLTTIVGLSPSNDDVLQRKSGAWTNRSVAQLKTDLSLTKSDVSLGNVDNTSDATKNSATATLTNKRVTPRVSTITTSATPSINTDNVEIFGITALAGNITSFTTNLSGTPTDGQKLIIYIVGASVRTIAWGSSFEAGPSTLPTITVAAKRLDIGFLWNASTSKWRCMASGSS